jgi:hypothetical protein
LQTVFAKSSEEFAETKSLLTVYSDKDTHEREITNMAGQPEIDEL